MEIDQQGIIEQIIEFRLSQETGTHELLIHWQDNKHSWEPFQQIYKDVPQLVEEFFKQEGKSIAEIVKIESEAIQRRQQHSYRGGRGRGGPIGFSNQRGGGRFQGGRGQGYLQQQQNEEFDPKKYKRMLKSRAADRKIQMWQNQANQQNQSMEQPNQQSPERRNENMKVDNEESKINPTRQAMLSETPQYVNPFQPNTLWKSAKDPISQVASVKDFIRDQKISQQQAKLQRAIELDRLKKAQVEKKEVIQRVQDQQPKNYSQYLTNINLDQRDDVMMRSGDSTSSETYLMTIFDFSKDQLVFYTTDPLQKMKLMQDIVDNKQSADCTIDFFEKMFAKATH